MSERPDHYARGIDPIDAIESWGLSFSAGNVVKYLARYQHKGDALGDLRKARYYIDGLIAEHGGGE